MSEQHAFPIGSVVRLKSGGPEMTVTSYQDKYVNLTWYSYGRDDFYDRCLPETALEAAFPVTHDGELEKHHG